jgi:glycosyltransferase involved in cell wall biosynthesis
MLSVIIATHDSERTLVPTLAALVPGAVAGVVREVIVADGGSRDHTASVADVAGCQFLVSSQPLAERLRAAAATARAPWLMFLKPGVVPGPTWIDDTAAFVGRTELSEKPRAAAFDHPGRDLRAALRRAFRTLPSPAQGLVIRKSFYDELGGHPDRVADPEAALVRRIGRSRIAILGASAFLPDT